MENMQDEPVKKRGVMDRMLDVTNDRKFYIGWFSGLIVTVVALGLAMMLL